MTRVLSSGAKSDARDFGSSLPSSRAAEKRANPLPLRHRAEAARQAPRLSGKRRSARGIAAHIYPVRLRWPSAAGNPAKDPEKQDPGNASRGEIQATLGARSAAIDAALVKAPGDSGGRVPHGKPDMAAFVVGRTSHDSPGQIAMLARRLGHAVAKKTGFGV
jgi:hypothetical protein